MPVNSILVLSPESLYSAAVAGPATRTAAATASIVRNMPILQTWDTEPARTLADRGLPQAMGIPARRPALTYRRGRAAASHENPGKTGAGVGRHPALNEKAAIPAAIESVRRQRPHEILVADGGSTDATVRVAGPLADRVLTAPRGRAAQMNAGAAAAAGDVLLFLHADCTLEDGAVAEAVRRLRSPRVAAGCFAMRVDADGYWFRSIDGCATARVRLTGIPYGDQGLFLTRKTFDRAGGFPPVRFMEDVLLGLRLRRLGRVVVARKRVFVSARRWRRVGVVRQTLRNWGFTALAAAGVHPDRMAAYYANVR